MTLAQRVPREQTDAIAEAERKPRSARRAVAIYTRVDLAGWPVRDTAGEVEC